MATGKMIINGRSYNVLTEMYKSIGSVNQILTDKPIENVEKRRRFFIVERNDVKFWVKQRLGIENVASLIAEFYRMKKYYRKLIIGNVIVRPVVAYEQEDDYLLMEYLEGYVRSTEYDNKDLVINSIKKWIEYTNIDCFDAHMNNFLVKEEGGSIDIALVDFELYADKSNKIRGI